MRIEQGIHPIGKERTKRITEYHKITKEDKLFVELWYMEKYTEHNSHTKKAINRQKETIIN